MILSVPVGAMGAVAQTIAPHLRDDVETSVLSRCLADDVVDRAR